MDPTTEKLHTKLADVRAEIQSVQAKIERQRAKLEELESNEKTVIDALELLGLEVPETDSEALTAASARRRRGKLRAIDVALRVVQPGESLPIEDIVKRVRESGLEFTSANPRNAIGTAMRRSPQFAFLGNGRFERRTADDIARSRADANDVVRSFPSKLNLENRS